MSISASDVNRLRQMTGAGMMDCKKALTEANGDFDLAIENLRKKGQKVSASRADRQTTEGAVFVHIDQDGQKGYLLALGCETDFVARNEDFRALGQAILAGAAQSSGTVDKDSVGSMEVNGRPVEGQLTDLMGKIGEKIEVVALEKVSGDRVASYIHSNKKIGVLVALTGVNGADVTEVGREVALQVASMKPLAVDKDGVDPTVVEREIEIGKEQARNEGKPEAILEKIAMGKLNKFYEENTLLNQSFVKDPSMSIRKLLESTQPGLSVGEFRRVSIG